MSKLYESQADKEYKAKIIAVAGALKQHAGLVMKTLNDLANAEAPIEDYDTKMDELDMGFAKAIVDDISPKKSVFEK